MNFSDLVELGGIVSVSPRGSQRDGAGGHPLEARERLARLKRLRAMREAELEGEHRTAEAMREDEETMRTNLENLRASAARHPGAPPVEMEAAEEGLTHIKEDRAQFAVRLQAAIRRTHGLRELSREGERTLAKMGRPAIFDPAHVKVTGPFSEAIARHMAEVDAGEAEVTRLREAVPPAETVKNQLRSRVETLAGAGRPEVKGLQIGATGPAGITWPTRFAPWEPSKLGTDLSPRMIDLEALACRYWKDQIVADLEAGVDETYGAIPDEDILDPTEKKRLLAEAEAEVDRLQRELAEIVWQALDVGEDVDFPADLPIRAILGVR